MYCFFYCTYYENTESCFEKGEHTLHCITVLLSTISDFFLFREG